MRYLILLTALLIAGCSSPTEVKEEEPQFEPVQIGNWLMVSEEKAEYTGVKGKFKADSTGIDTVDINTPDGIHMEIQENEKYPYFDLVITDSTIVSTDQYQAKMYFGEGTVYDFAITPANYPHRFANLDHTVLTARTKITCLDEGRELQEFIYVEWYKQQDQWEFHDPVLVYRIDVDGIYDTGYEIACTI